MLICRSDQFGNSNRIKVQRKSSRRSKGLYNHIREISVLETSRAVVKEFCDALLRDCRRKPPPINITHGLVALDRLNPPIRKGHKSSHSD